MARNTVICINEDGVTVEIGHKSRRFEHGEVFHTNRWYYQRLMELYRDDFKDYSPKAEAEAKPPRHSSGAEPKRRKKDEGNVDKSTLDAGNVEVAT